jgi:ketosteroid isomerase-like protein
MTMKETVLAFIDRINAHDVDGIVGMMAEDYQFVNSSGDVFHGKEFMRDTWRTHFVLHPDFRINVKRVVNDDETVAVFGVAEGTYSPDGDMEEENHWETPSAFLGIARDGKMTHWQVYSDASIVFDIIKTDAT